MKNENVTIILPWLLRKILVLIRVCSRNQQNGKIMEVLPFHISFKKELYWDYISEIVEAIDTNSNHILSQFLARLTDLPLHCTDCVLHSDKYISLIIIQDFRLYVLLKMAVEQNGNASLLVIFILILNSTRVVYLGRVML